MPTTFGAATTPAAVLAAVRQQVARVTGVPISRVLPSLATDAMHLKFPPADRFVTVRPLRLPPHPPTQAGMGRNHQAVDATVRVALFQRLAGDTELRNHRSLEDETAGVLKFWSDTVSALEQFAPLSTPGGTQSILREPMRQAPAGWDVMPHDTQAGPWCVVAGPLEVKFVLDIPEAVP